MAILPAIHLHVRCARHLFLVKHTLLVDIYGGSGTYWASCLQGLHRWYVILAEGHTF